MPQVKKTPLPVPPALRQEQVKPAQPLDSLRSLQVNSGMKTGVPARPVQAKPNTPLPLAKPVIKGNTPVSRGANNLSQGKTPISSQRQITPINLKQFSKNSNISNKTAQAVRQRVDAEEDAESIQTTGGQTFGRKLKLAVLSSIPIIIIIVGIIIWQSGGEPQKLSKITCKNDGCEKEFTLPENDVKGKAYVECTHCKKKVVLDEKKAAREADLWVLKAKDLVDRSGDYTVSDPAKAKSLIKDASDWLDKASGIYNLIPSTEGSYHWNLMMDLRKIIRTKRTL